MPRKNYVSGFGEKDPDAKSFLEVDRDPWDASASGQGYNSRWDDDTGVERGAEYGFSNTADDKAFLRPSSLGDYDVAHERLAGLIDDSQPYDPRLTGGTGLTHGKGVGDGKPRYTPKAPGPQSNARKPR